MKKLILFPVLMGCIHGVYGRADLDQYKIEWRQQSENSSGSMPCGGGDVGLNVWTENNDVLFYISRSNTFDENNALLKLGRIRLTLEPALFGASDFRQVLNPENGTVTIYGGGAELTIRTDVFHPVVQLSLKSKTPVALKATYENWRFTDFTPNKQEFRSNSYKFPRKEFDVKTYRDSVMELSSGICFFHRNRNDVESVFDVSVRLQGLDAVKDSLHDPIRNRTFGGLLTGDGFIQAGDSEGIYQDTPFRAKSICSDRPRRNHELNLYLHTACTNTTEEWKKGLQQVANRSEQTRQMSWKHTEAWWKEYWNRSYIAISGDTASAKWQVGRNYQLFRFMLGCNAYGEYPTKFNGGLFTFDPIFVKPDTPGTPDFRYWGGGTMTAQNQRLVYWPMLKNGDIELMKPQFEFYQRSLRTAEIRSEFYWNHKGACFTEQIENFGLPNIAEYGYGKPNRYDKGMEYNKWLEYQWETILEFCLMILETERYQKADISAYLPLIESSLAFFDEHYQMLARSRGAAVWTDDHKYVFYPSSAAETYKMAYNSTTLVCGLKAVIEQLLCLDDTYTPDRARWTEMLARIPEIPVREIDGQKRLLPAENWARVQNSEAPQLYPVFPYRYYGVGKPDIETAVNTYWNDPQVIKYKTHEGWRQHPIFAACLGLTEEARMLVEKKMENGQFRFPAFRGPGMDWTPDHNWLGAGSIALQEMLMQCNDREILLAPAWPKDWDVKFKLHAPYQTVVSGEIRNGRLKSLIVTPKEREKDVRFLLGE